MSCPSAFKRKFKRVIQIELNEISTDVIGILIQRGKLPFFKKINQEWSYFQTESEKIYAELEPWIQWTTAHTGKSLAEHKILHLSDAPYLAHEQIWETLSRVGIESAVLSPMNAKRGKTKGGMFFPDPWSKYNDSYPEGLSSLWRLISRKVQGHAVDPLTTRELFEGMMTCLRFRLPLPLYLKIAKQLVIQKVSPLSKWKLAAIFDVFLSQLFERLLNTTNYGFYSLFLNSVAHYQHHYWRNFDKKIFASDIQTEDLQENHDPITFGYEEFDRILGRIIRKYDQADTLILVASGLSQIPYLEKEEEGGMNYYRLNKHADFVQVLGLHGYQVCPLMSRDWQIGGVNPQKLSEARRVLEKILLGGKPLFQVSQNSTDFLFVETAVTRRVAPHESIVGENQKAIATFGEVFSKIAVKSGHHSGIGSLWCSEKELSKGFLGAKRIPLGNLFHLNCQALGVELEEVEKKSQAG